MSEACPKCGHAEVETDECPRCRVIISKYRVCHESPGTGDILEIALPGTGARASAIRWWTQHPWIVWGPGRVMITLSSLRWTHWLLLLAIGLFLATYLGLVSWEPVHETIEWLASQPARSDTFQNPGGRQEALLLLVSVLLLTPIAASVTLFLLVSALAILAELLASVGLRLGLPHWTLIVMLSAGFASVAYATRSVWLPWSLELLGLLAQAYLTVLR
ncbi:MAG: hypothetical protein ACE5MG_13065 [Candidatus Methylomirabilales bacterium]